VYQERNLNVASLSSFFNIAKIARFYISILLSSCLNVVEVRRVMQISSVANEKTLAKIVIDCVIELCKTTMYIYILGAKFEQHSKSVS